MNTRKEIRFPGSSIKETGDKIVSSKPLYVGEEELLTASKLGDDFAKILREEQEVTHGTSLAGRDLALSGNLSVNSISISSVTSFANIMLNGSTTYRGIYFIPSGDTTWGSGYTKPAIIANTGGPYGTIEVLAEYDGIGLIKPTGNIIRCSTEGLTFNTTNTTVFNNFKSNGLKFIVEEVYDLETVKEKLEAHQVEFVEHQETVKNAALEEAGKLFTRLNLKRITSIFGKTSLDCSGKYLRFEDLPEGSGYGSATGGNLLYFNNGYYLSSTTTFNGTVNGITVPTGPCILVRDYSSKVVEALAFYKSSKLVSTGQSFYCDPKLGDWSIREDSFSSADYLKGRSYVGGNDIAIYSNSCTYEKVDKTFKLKDGIILWASELSTNGFAYDEGRLIVRYKPGLYYTVFAGDEALIYDYNPSAGETTINGRSISLSSDNLGPVFRLYDVLTDAVVLASKNSGVIDTAYLSANFEQNSVVLGESKLTGEVTSEKAGFKSSLDHEDRFFFSLGSEEWNTSQQFVIKNNTQGTYYGPFLTDILPAGNTTVERKIDNFTFIYDANGYVCFEDPADFRPGDTASLVVGNNLSVSQPNGVLDSLSKLGSTRLTCLGVPEPGAGVGTIVAAKFSDGSGIIYSEDESVFVYATSSGIEVFEGDGYSIHELIDAIFLYGNGERISVKDPDLVYVSPEFTDNGSFGDFYNFFFIEKSKPEDIIEELAALIGDNVGLTKVPEVGLDCSKSILSISCNFPPSIIESGYNYLELVNFEGGILALDIQEDRLEFYCNNADISSPTFLTLYLTGEKSGDTSILLGDVGKITNLNSVFMKDFGLSLTLTSKKPATQPIKKTVRALENSINSKIGYTPISSAYVEISSSEPMVIEELKVTGSDTYLVVVEGWLGETDSYSFILNSDNSWSGGIDGLRFYINDTYGCLEVETTTTYMGYISVYGKFTWTRHMITIEGHRTSSPGGEAYQAYLNLNVLLPTNQMVGSLDELRQLMFPTVLEDEFNSLSYSGELSVPLSKPVNVLGASASLSNMMVASSIGFMFGSTDTLFLHGISLETGCSTEQFFVQGFTDRVI